MLNNAQSPTTLTSSFVAGNAVSGLFANNNPSTNAPKSTTDQQAIDAAQKLVDGVADATARANMQVSYRASQRFAQIKRYSNGLQLGTRRCRYHIKSNHWDSR
ncbi:hypothetical protein HCJ39_12490 [Listeria rocourtiae]|nr:hypothetical protein [Listeria rocourtiae]